MTEQSANTRPANILFTSSFGTMLGGGQYSLLLLLKTLDRKRFCPILLVPEDGELARRARAQGIACHVLAMPAMRALHLPTIVRLVRFIRRHQIDLIHCDAPRQVFYAGLAARCCRRPLLWHIRVADPDRPMVDWLLFRLAHRLIAVSQAAASRFAAEPDRNTIAIIPNGIILPRPQPDHYPEVRQEFSCGDEHILLGCVGRLHPGKGQETLLNALATMGPEERQQFRLLLVGDGESDYRRHLQALARRTGMEEMVHFTGRRDDVPRLLAAMDIFVLPGTLAEGFSRVIMEAMAAGLPVIATGLGGNREAIIDGQTGLLLPAHFHRRDLQDRLLKLARAPLLRQAMGRRARQYALDYFDHAKTTAAIESVYSAILGGTP